MLTPRQVETLAFITNHLVATGSSPTYKMIMGHLGLTSKSGVHRLVVALEDRGFIRRLPSRARAITLVKPPVDIIGSTAIINLIRIAAELCDAVDGEVDDIGIHLRELRPAVEAAMLVVGVKP